jgi:transcriptional antiterminator RfaH
MLDAASVQPVTLPHQDAAPAHNRRSAPSGCRPKTTWHVVATKPRAERIAHAALHLRGYNPYLPLLLTRPLFPGYLFIQLGLGQPWYPIAWCPGVYSLLSTAGKPNVVARAVISALQAGDEMRATPIPKSTQWAPGMPCRLAVGPFKGQPAVVAQTHNTRTLVSLIVLGYLRQIDVATSCLQHRED